MGLPERCARRLAEMSSETPDGVAWNTLTDTEAYATQVAAQLERGQVILLDGPLGAGKTTFVAALARAMGSDADVSSPSYTLMHEYPSPAGVLLHIDLYRLPEGTRVEATLDLDDAIDRAYAVLIEWGGRLSQALPEAWWLDITRDDQGRWARWHPGRGPNLAGRS